MSDLCPNCGLREQDTPSGFCSACTVERLAEAYAAQDRVQGDLRRAAWAGERTGNRYNLLRYHRKTLMEVVRPRRPSSTFDPWTLARDALEDLEHMRSRVTISRLDLDNLAESIRRLAWGPDDGVVYIHRSRHRLQIPGQLTLWPTEEAIAA